MTWSNIDFGIKARMFREFFKMIEKCRVVSVGRLHAPAIDAVTPDPLQVIFCVRGNSVICHRDGLSL